MFLSSYHHLVVDYQLMQQELKKQIIFVLMHQNKLEKTNVIIPDGSNPEPAIKFGAILAIVFNAVFEADC